MTGESVSESIALNDLKYMNIDKFKLSLLKKYLHFNWLGKLTLAERGKMLVLAGTNVVNKEEEHSA